MTARRKSSPDRFSFSAVASAYIFVAVHFLEERDLIKVFGGRYLAYMKHVPSYLPIRFGRPGRAVEVAAEQR